MTSQEIAYERRYGHEEILKTVDSFSQLLRKDAPEEEIQVFIEQNKVMLARFHPTKIFTKPGILGKYKADFGVLDSQGVLTLIELERPALPLFKDSAHQEGHLMQAFNHAYEQVRDWLFEVQKHRAAVLEGIGLRPEEVLDVRGVVIGGRRKPDELQYLQRHLSSRKDGIDFLTLDDLASSVLQISRDLA